jgi:hypothetical protein
MHIRQPPLQEPSVMKHCSRCLVCDILLENHNRIGSKRRYTPQRCSCRCGMQSAPGHRRGAVPRGLVQADHLIEGKQEAQGGVSLLIEQARRGTVGQLIQCTCLRPHSCECWPYEVCRWQRSHLRTVMVRRQTAIKSRNESGWMTCTSSSCCSDA